MEFLQEQNPNEMVQTFRLPGIANENNAVLKRKYRRHPKADENAPKRPPTAYVLFANKIRQDLKDENLTFSEIAKIVGKNWRTLPDEEKKTYEDQANAAKIEYDSKFVEYRKTSNYRHYMRYRRLFSQKQAQRH
ncbi:hypothetical protein QQS21_009581, partial [Conoideocrella luteorostrata]